MRIESENSVAGDSPTVLYQSEHVLGVYKPPGLIVHSDGRTDEPTLVAWLLGQYPELAGVGEPQRSPEGRTLARHGIVHRLDRDTSGVMVVARTQEGYKRLKRQFQARTVEKTYCAFVYGTIKDDSGVVDRPIGKSKSDFRLWSAQRAARGKLREAVTAYTVRARGSDATYLSLTPQTGRTHQIRVHMKAIHHPVVCDPLYAPKRDCILGFQRLALHASSITLSLPDGTSITVEAALPPDFQNAIKQLSKD